MSFTPTLCVHGRSWKMSRERRWGAFVRQDFPLRRTPHGSSRRSPRRDTSTIHRFFPLGTVMGECAAHAASPIVWGGRREPDRVPDLGRGSIWETDVLLWGRLLAPVSLRADTAHGAAGAGRRPAGGLLRSSARDRPRAPAPAHERRPPVQVLCQPAFHRSQTSPHPARVSDRDVPRVSGYE